MVQGSKATPDKVDEEIDEVIKLVRDQLKGLSAKKLKEYKANLEDNILKKDTNLSERAGKVWDEIRQNTLDFNYYTSLKAELDKVQLQDLMDFFDNTFITNPQKLSIQVLYSINYFKDI